MAGPPAALLVVAGRIDPASALSRLAAAHGVATWYESQDGRRVEVSAESVIGVLAALGVDASTPSAGTRALRDHRDRPVPPTVVAWAGTPTRVTVPPQTVASFDGSPLPVDGGTLVIPTDAPVGWHVLRTQDDDATHTSAVVVAPPVSAASRDHGRHWGLAVQLYALRARESWGMGDLADLERLVRWTGEQGGGVVLCNPLHAAALTDPLEPSPYYPTSRRFANPLYLRVEALPEYAAAAGDVRAEVDRLAADARRLNTRDRIDRDSVWRAKHDALHALFVASHPAPEPNPARDTFALWCALAEEHGRDWRRWPAELRRPDDPAVRGAADRLRDRVRFHAWLQICCDRQLEAVTATARDAGMPIGVVHDLAVGVDPGGADAWALQDSLALGATIGAPPDSFNQQGQDWQLPPWRPDRLAETGYAAYRETVAATLRHGGGIRVDHVLGLFRLWWIPTGRSPRDGTYVRYDADALLAALLVEAHPSAALLVGEDLGTVERHVQDVLSQRGVLGTSVLWFERDRDGALEPPGEWRAAAVASASTHDLPTVAGFLRGEHVRVRAELGLLDDAEEEWRRHAAEVDEILTLLRAEGLLGVDPTVEDVTAAIHAFLARTPSRVVLASPADAVGDVRQPNLPGTRDEYPNWRLPVADGAGRPVALEDLLAAPGLARLVRSVRGSTDRGVNTKPGTVR